MLSLLNGQGGSKGDDDLPEGEPLPGRPGARVGREVACGADAEQPVEQPRVRDVHFGSLHLSRRDVLVPRLELAHHERARERIE